jgi:Cu-processing system ATP-binding protein
MIVFDKFSKRFGPVEAIADLTMTVEPGEIVALLGPNGSGKTTSIKAAAGLIRPTAGRVLIGRPGRPAVDPSARECCSFLPQAVAFPDGLTGREVIDFYGRLRGRGDARVHDVLKMTGLNGASGRPVATYSGGMKQRLGLAVAMLPESPVLLLDEPTAALDSDGLCAFYGLVESRRARAQTMLFSSHQMGDVERLADRIVVLIGGRMVSSLTASELAAALAERGLMRVTLDRPRPDLMPAVSALARKVTQHGSEVFVVAPPAARAAVLDVLRNGGAEIRGLTAEEGRLDRFYRELVGGAR